MIPTPTISAGLIGLRRLRPRTILTGLVWIGVSGCNGCDHISDTASLNDVQSACAETGSAAKDYSDFLRDYGTNAPAASVDLANMSSSLAVAAHDLPSSGQTNVASAIQAAQNAVDAAQKALNNHTPVDTNALTSTMSDLGNACSMALGA